MKDVFLARMAEGAAKVLDEFDPASGRFMTSGHEGPDKGWAVTNQDVMYPLALLRMTPHAANPYHGDGDVLGVVGKAGDAVCDWQQPDGQVEFIKVDGSRWGPTYMPWTMYHWVETLALVREELSPDRRRRWEKGLSLAYDGIARSLRESDYRVHNIPTWNGMGLTRAAQVFGREDWGEVGRKMIRRTVAEQTEYGYWNEHGGPSTVYNSVYVHALGLYHAFTRDDSVLEALRRGLEFHLTFTYPDGSMVETIDGRVKYHPGVQARALTAYGLFPEGRRFVRWLMTRASEAGEMPSCTPMMASACHYYRVGDEASIPQDRESYTRAMGDWARVAKEGPWFHCVSAILAKPTENRWGMDRQSFVSLYRGECGLIVGGGNSKDQPAWSSFVVGKRHLPDSARLRADGVELDYGSARCSIRVACDNEGATLSYGLEDNPNGEPVSAQVLLHVVPKQVLTTGRGESLALDGAAVQRSGEDLGGRLTHNGWRLNLPDDAVFEYPVSPFNPYAKDGQAGLDQAVGVVRVKLDGRGRPGEVRVTRAGRS